MKLVCPQCATPYDVESAALGASGRSVRCARCQRVWFASPPRAAPGFVTIAPGKSALPPRAAVPPPNTAPADLGSLASVRPERSTGPEAARSAPKSEPAPDDIGIAEAPLVPSEAFPPTAIPDESVLAADAPALAPLADQAMAPQAEALGPAPAVEHAGLPAADSPAHADVETTALRRTGRRRLPQRRRGARRISKLWAAVIVFAILDLAAVVWRAEVVRAVPQTASLFRAIGLPVNLRGLAFDHVTTAEEQRNGVNILVVQGTIASTSRRPVSVPRLRFSVRSDGGHEIYAWTALPNRSRLAPGETMSFRSRLASPPPEARTIAVRFFTRGDLAAGQP